MPETHFMSELSQLIIGFISGGIIIALIFFFTFVANRQESPPCPESTEIPMSELSELTKRIEDINEELKRLNDTDVDLEEEIQGLYAASEEVTQMFNRLSFKINEAEAAK